MVPNAVMDQYDKSKGCPEIQTPAWLQARRVLSVNRVPALQIGTLRYFFFDAERGKLLDREPFEPVLVGRHDIAHE